MSTGNSLINNFKHANFHMAISLFLSCKRSKINSFSCSDQAMDLKEHAKKWMFSYDNICNFKCPR